MYRDFIIYYGITEIKSDMGLFFENLEKKNIFNLEKKLNLFISEMNQNIMLEKQCAQLILD